MGNQTVIDIFTKIFASYNLLLIIAAVVLNPLLLFVCIKSSRLRSTSTFKILAFGAINDLLTCLIWNEENFTNTFFDFQPYFRSFFYCRWLTMFLQYTTFELESWILVSISLDRALSLTVKKWTKYYFNGIKPIIYCIVLTIVVIGVNLNQLFTIGYTEIVNGTEIIGCFWTRPNEFDWYQLNAQMSLYFGFILPYCLLVLLNAVIIYKATRFQRHHINSTTILSRTSSARRKSQMSKMVIFITFLFILTSLPSTIVTGHLYDEIISLDAGQMLINLIDGVQFTYPSFNFFILFFSNKLFAKEVKLVFMRFGFNKNRITDINSGSKTNTSTLKDANGF